MIKMTKGPINKMSKERMETRQQPRNESKREKEEVEERKMINEKENEDDDDGEMIENPLVFEWVKK